MSRVGVDRVGTKISIIKSGWIFKDGRGPLVYSRASFASKSYNREPRKGFLSQSFSRNRGVLGGSMDAWWHCAEHV